MDLEPNPAQLPTRIGARYEVLAELGRGGMAVVYRVRDLGRGEEVALKQLLPPREATKAREATALFEREFYTLAQLSHPGVVEVYDFGRDSSRAYYTMQLVEGRDLSEGAPWPYGKACELIAQVCSSLSLLHSRGLVHRDISPRNVRCTQAGAAKLIDFGAMVPMGPNAQIVGTPAFIAPEVLHQLPLDGRADLFSLGATLYYALTGRSPFAARTFADLRDLWRVEPLPPSQLTAAIPPALDALVSSMLRIDPAQRPRSAFEVMQRLCAIAGIECAEPEDISQAYLSTPTLIGREAELAEFRTLVTRAGKGHGAGLAVEGVAGVGRSRLIDACVLDAKLLAATVARVSGGAASSAPFASALKLAEHFLEANPDLALESAREAGVLEVLFQASADSAGPTLRALGELEAEWHVLQSAFANWLRAAGRRQPLVIAVDDAERLDQATLGLLAGLANEAHATQLVLLAAVVTPVTPGLSPALDVLRSRSEVWRLEPLTREQTESLFSSVFAGAPHVAMLSDRVYELAGGNPRESMALASHLLDSKRIHYADGSWVLPADLTVTDLPSNAAEACRVRVESLPELARRLAELQALALPGAWTRADYAELAGAERVANVDQALNTLLRQGVLVSDSGETYRLAHSGIRFCLVNALGSDAAAERHLALAEHCALREQSGLAEVHHLLLAGAEQRALDALNRIIVADADRTDSREASGLRGNEIAAILERAHALALKHGRPPRETFELARHLTSLSVVATTALHARYGVMWAEQLVRDSGLADYGALDPNLPAAERLQKALATAVARYEATPVNQRVFRVDEAIKYLARYVTVCIVVASRKRDARLAERTPAMLEPFTSLSPVLHALWQNALAAYEMNFGAQPVRARARVLAVYERLGEIQGDELRYAEMIRTSIAFAIGSLNLLLGYSSEIDWFAIAEKEPMQQVNAAYYRRLGCLTRGDLEGAERLRRRAEVLAVQAREPQMFPPPLLPELFAQARLGDLAAVKQVVDQLAQLAAEEPGRESQVCLGRAVYQRLRGDLPAAQQALERCLELTDPANDVTYPDRPTWLSASADYLVVLRAAGQVERAYELGTRCLERCAAWGVDPPPAEIVRQVALVEAKLGRHSAAVCRIEALIASRQALVVDQRALDYEVRAQVAIEGRDSETAVHYATLTREHQLGANTALLSRQAQLMEQARRAGMDVSVPATAFEHSVFGESQRPARLHARTRVATLFYDAHDPAERAQRSLEALCQSARASSGVLYLARASGLQAVASLQMEASSALDQQVGSYWLQQLEDGDMTAPTVETSGATLDAPPLWRDAHGRGLQLMLLKCTLRATLLYLGVAVLATEHEAPPKATTWELAHALSTRLLELGDASGVCPG
jgi:tetratricopeptide (TPR) repeat protein